MNFMPSTIHRVREGGILLFVATILIVMVATDSVPQVNSLTTTTTTTTTPVGPGRPQQLSAVLFDIDGTLVHSDPIHLAVFQELLLEQEGFNNNQPIDEDFFRKWISGRVNSQITADFFPMWSVTDREAWSIRKEARFREIAQTSMLERKMPGLDRLRTFVDQHGLQKAAVTNAPRLNAEAILSGIGYDTWFGQQCLIIGDECAKPKPDPCPYLTACQRLEVHPQECIVLEDSPSGARAGVAAGAFVVGILSGQEREVLEKAGCHLIVQDFNDPVLWKYLESFLTTKQQHPHEQQQRQAQLEPKSIEQ
jgi:beta-phosphoglucomutase-like phosphatase (HAD superfamily)